MCIRDRFVAEVAAQQSEEDIQKNTQIPVIRKKISEIENKIRNLTKALECASVAPDAIVERLAELEAQKKGLSTQLSDEERGVIPLTKESVVVYLKAVREKAVPLETQKAMLIEMLVNSVTVYDDEPGFLKLVYAYRLTQIPTRTYRVPIPAKVPCSDFRTQPAPK